MLKEVKIIRVYNLVNPKGKRLQLRLCILHPDDREKFCGDTGYRWSFLGTEIPMPVRAGTWFNGFPADTMIAWLAENGWYLATEVSMASGEVKVHGLPEPEEAYHDYQFANDQMEFNKLIKELYENGKRTNAIFLYRYAHEVGTQTAIKAVREICAE